jgi:hypothetical protein
MSRQKLLDRLRSAGRVDALAKEVAAEQAIEIVISEAKPVSVEQAEKKRAAAEKKRAAAEASKPAAAAKKKAPAKKKPAAKKAKADDELWTPGGDKPAGEADKLWTPGS